MLVARDQAGAGEGDAEGGGGDPGPDAQPSTRASQILRASQLMPADGAHLELPVEGEGEDIRRILITLWTRWPLVLLIVLASTAVAAVQTYRLPPIFASSARLKLAQESADPAAAKLGAAWEGVQTEYLNTQLRILESQSLAVEVVKNNPDIARELEVDLTGGQGTKVDPDTLAAAFRAGVSVAPVRETYLVDVTYQSTDPARCPRYANALATAYLDQLKSQLGTMNRLTEEKLVAQSVLLQTKLGESETRLREFLASNDAPLAARHEDLLVTRIASNNQALAVVQQTRLRLDADIEAIQRVVELGRPIESAPAIARNDIVAALRMQLTQAELDVATHTERYGEDWPLVKSHRTRRDQLRLLLRQEIETLRSRLQSERDAASSEERGLLEHAAELSQSARELAKRVRLFDAYNNEVNASRELYKQFVDRLNDVRYWGNAGVTTMRIIDAALGASRIGPNHTRNIGVGAAFGMALAVGLALLLERLGDRLRSTSDVTRALRLPVLGVVPDVREVAEDQLDLYALTRPHSIYAEAFRRLRVQLDAVGSFPETGCGIMVVTSGVPREGKTLSSINLAVAEAQAGRRTLLIDADMRGPRIHKTFELDVSPGLGEVLSAKALWGTVIRPSLLANLSVMTAGKPSDNPAELLARGDSFRELLDRLRGHFDRVIIDTPPAAAVTDASLMAPFTDATLLVVSGRASSRSASVLARTELTRVGCEPRGILFNHQTSQDPGYYSYYRYDRGYPTDTPPHRDPGQTREPGPELDRH